ncbi:hypothetical protein BRD18_02130 [Halobacteriales archaeon SW_7_71_33]|nr:MAG: hypothetical protein BRD18_02130 [Halobacteriales archaeon SW_7_71_33]
MTRRDTDPDRTDHTFETDAVFDPETYLPTVEATLGEERTRTEAEFVADRFGTDERLLDAPCGHGRHANRLAARGHAVAGLDRSSAFLDRARADASDRGVAERVDYRQGDLRSLPYDDAAFDGVYNLLTSFGFFDEADNRKQLAEFARVLRPGGRLVMELAHRDGVLYDYRPAGVTRTEAGTVVEERSFDPRTGRNRSERLTVLAPDARTDGGDTDPDPARERRPGSVGPHAGADDSASDGPEGRDPPDGYRRVQAATFEVRLYSFTELRRDQGSIPSASAIASAGWTGRSHRLRSSICVRQEVPGATTRASPAGSTSRSWSNSTSPMARLIERCSAS